jgi:L-lactate permease
LKWRKIPERKRAALRLSPMAGRFHRHPTFSVVVGVIGVVLFGSVMAASIFFAISRP